MSKTPRRLARFVIPAALVLAASTVFAPTASAQTMFCGSPIVSFDSAFASCSGSGWALLQGDCGLHYRVYHFESRPIPSGVALFVRCPDHAPITNARISTS